MNYTQKDYEKAFQRADQYSQQSLDLLEVLDFALRAHEAIQVALKFFEQQKTPLDNEGDLASDAYSKLFGANEETPYLIKELLK